MDRGKDVWTDTWTDALTDAWTDGQMDERTDKTSCIVDVSKLKRDVLRSFKGTFGKEWKEERLFFIFYFLKKCQ